jgi:hypothetical protein
MSQKHKQPKSENDIAPPQLMRRGGYKTLIQPPERDVMLCFPFAFTLGSSATISRRFTVNGAYDVDPTVGSTSTPGFAEYAAFYNFYRVVRCSYRVSISNTDALPVVAYVYFSNSDPGTGLPYTVIGNPLCKWKLLSAGGGGYDTVTLGDTQTIATILGSNEVEVGEQYRALTNAVPADLAWMTVGVHTPSGTALTAGAVNVVVSIRMLTRFFDRISALVSFKDDLTFRRELERILEQVAALQTQLSESKERESLVMRLYLESCGKDKLLPVPPASSSSLCPRPGENPQ